MTSKLVIRESELPRPVTSSILTLRIMMTSSSVIIPYRMVQQDGHYNKVFIFLDSNLEEQKVALITPRVCNDFFIKIPP